MDLRGLMTFSKIAELGSFSKAAEYLGYTQSAVSIQMKELEKELNVRLFDRIGKKIYLTEQGKEALEKADHIILLSQRLKDIASQDELSGKVRIGTLASLYTPLFLPILESFHRAHPHVEIMVKLGVTKELIELLQANKVDLILTLDTPYHFPNWMKINDKIEQCVLFSSANHPLASKESLSVDDILQEEFILTRTDCNYRRSFEEILQSQNKSVKPYLEIDDMHTIKTFVAQSSALSLLPKITIKKELDSGIFSVLDLNEIQIELHTQLFCHKYKWLTPAMKEFIRFLERNIFKQE